MRMAGAGTDDLFDPLLRAGDNGDTALWDFRRFNRSKLDLSGLVAISGDFHEGGMG